jgi:hypothetical protein
LLYPVNWGDNLNWEIGLSFGEWPK